MIFHTIFHMELLFDWWYSLFTTLSGLWTDVTLTMPVSESSWFCCPRLGPLEKSSILLNELSELDGDSCWKFANLQYRPIPIILTASWQSLGNEYNRYRHTNRRWEFFTFNNSLLHILKIYVWLYTIEKNLYWVYLNFLIHNTLKSKPRKI